MTQATSTERRSGTFVSEGVVRCLNVLSAADAIARAVPPHNSPDIRGRAQRQYVGLKAEKYSTKMEN